jgi:hypothetical protein
MEIIMADYHQSTVVQQIIPDADMTPIERLLLCKIFESERVNDGWYFFAEDCPAVVIGVHRKELEQALAPSPADSTASTCVAEQLASANPDASDIDLDFSGTSGDFFFQDIVKRSTTPNYITIVSAFTSSKMRDDGFGGMAVLITRDAIVGKSTGDFWKA